jgi:hypothetical protein
VFIWRTGLGTRGHGVCLILSWGSGSGNGNGGSSWTHRQEEAGPTVLFVGLSGPFLLQVTTPSTTLGTKPLACRLLGVPTHIQTMDLHTATPKDPSLELSELSSSSRL